MKINEMTATFGRLENETLILKDGLNVIVRPNLKGKSTWCAFIRDMLYGIDPDETARKNYIPDKTIFKPWSGKNMKGSMVITNNDEKILITRDTNDNDHPLDIFKASYERTGQDVEGLSGDNCGEKLMGISKNVFSRSAFVRQGSLMFDNSPNLERRILSLISSGEEGIIYSDADTRLRNWQRKRRFSTKGKLPELESDLSKSVYDLESMQTDIIARDELAKQYEESELKCKSIAEDLKKNEESSQKENQIKIEEATKKLQVATDKYAVIRSKSKADRAVLAKNPMIGMDPEKLKEQAKVDIKVAKSMSKKQMDKGSLLLTLLFAFLVIASLALGLILRKYRLYLYPFVGIFFIGAVWSEIKYIKKNGRAQHAYYERLKILDKYHVKDENEISKAINDYIRSNLTARSSIAAEKEALEYVRKCRQEKTDLEKGVYIATESISDSESVASLKIKLNEAIQNKEKLLAELQRVEQRIQSYGDPMVLKSNIENIKKEHQKIQEDYDAISIALDIMREADIDIENRFSSKINVLAAMYMSFMTDGKYEEVKFDNKIVKELEYDDELTSTSEYLDAGTFDLLYLATRLAVCHLAMPDGSSCPIILDDPLVNFNPEREKMAMKLLSEMAKTRQIIIFSCHELSA